MNVLADLLTVLFLYLAYIGAVLVVLLTGTCLFMLLTGRPRVETHPGYLPEDVPRRFTEDGWTADDERAALEEYARS